MVLVSALQAAQSEARAQGVPVGIALPCTGGDAAAGFYKLSGAVMPRVVDVTDLRSEFPGTYLASVNWGSLSQAQPDTGDDFMVGTWAQPNPADPTLIFLPSGKVLSNGLCHSDGNYRIVLGSGFALGSPLSGAGDPVVAAPAPTYALTSVANAQTVTVNQSGAISLVNGVPDQPDLEVASAPAPSVGALPSLDIPSGQPPEILAVKALPQPDDMPSGVDAVIPQNGMLSLVVEAWSPEGEALFAEWSGQGEFSVSEPVPLEWYPLEAIWRGTVEWKVPTTMVEGDDVELTVRVADKYSDTGLNVSGQIISALNVEVTRPNSKILFQAQTATHQVFDDASGEKELFDQELSSPRWSPDGTKIAAIDASNTQVVLALPETGVVKVLHTGSGLSTPRWSPDGTKVAFVCQNDLCVETIDGSSSVQITPSDGKEVYGGYNWSPDGQKLVYAETFTNIGDMRLWTANPDGTARTMITTRDSKFPVWAPVENRILFLGDEPTGGNTAANIYSMNPDGTGETLEVDNTGWGGYGWNTDTVLGLSSDRRFVSHNVQSAAAQGLIVKDRIGGQVYNLTGTHATSGQWGLWSPVDDKVISVDSTTSSLMLSQPDGGGRVSLSTVPTWSADWTR